MWARTRIGSVPHFVITLGLQVTIRVSRSSVAMGIAIMPDGDRGRALGVVSAPCGCAGGAGVPGRKYGPDPNQQRGCGNAVSGVRRLFRTGAQPLRPQVVGSAHRGPGGTDRPAGTPNVLRQRRLHEEDLRRADPGADGSVRPACSGPGAGSAVDRVGVGWQARCTAGHAIGGGGGQVDAAAAATRSARPAVPDAPGAGGGRIRVATRARLRDGAGQCGDRAAG